MEIATDQGMRRSPLVDFFMERYADAYAAEMRAFVKALETKSEPPTTGHDGLMALALAEAAVRSAAEGRAVKIGEVL